MTLYLLPVLGDDPDDLTFRARRHIGEVAVIFAEDQAQAQRLCEAIGVKTTIQPLSAFDTSALAGDALLWIRHVSGVAALVNRALQAGMAVIPLPGGAAVITEVVASGLPTDSFLVGGILTSETATTRFARHKDERRTLVYGFPKGATEVDREALVAAAGAFFGGRRIISGAMLIIEGAPDLAPQRWTADQVVGALHHHLAKGESRRAAAKAVAALSGWETRDLYDLSLEIGE
ncbi:MAG TPA: hypothetical protein PLD47_16760 [Aggregatilineales bacterium]|nr:hypothetical protein [Anaerolineales bacterium]HRE49378.1 hypothetical protein [Aggregatilineales bacterium]